MFMLFILFLKNSWNLISGFVVFGGEFSCVLCVYVGFSIYFGRGVVSRSDYKSFEVWFWKIF